MEKEKKFRKKWETSKILLFINLVIAIIITGFSMYICVAQETAEPLYYTVPSVFAEVASATGFYYWKAKNENKVKMVLSSVEEMSRMEGLTDEETRVLEVLIGTLD